MQDTEWNEEYREKLSSLIGKEITITRAGQGDSTISEIVDGYQPDKILYMWEIIGKTNKYYISQQRELG